MKSIAKRLVLVASDKGGVGKSTFTMTLWERLLNAGANARAFDLDGTTGSFARRYGCYDSDGYILDPQPANGVTPLMLHGTDDDRDATADSLLDTGADVVVADAPATALTAFQSMESEWSFASEVAKAGYSLTIVTVCTPFPESIANVNLAMDVFPTASHVVVLNEALGDVPDDYALWFGDRHDDIPQATAKTRLERLGSKGAEIVFPRIKVKPLVLAAKLFLTLGAATTDERIRRASRSRLAIWLSRAADEARPANQLLGLPEATTTKATA